MAFGRKKNERPKNTLGLALFRYDRIINIDLKNIIGTLESGKQLNLKRSALLLIMLFLRLMSYQRIFQKIISKLITDPIKHAT